MFRMMTLRLVCIAVGAPLMAFCVAGAALAQGSARIDSFKNIADFEMCLRRSYGDEDCLIALERFIRATPGEAMNAARIVRLKFNATVSLRFFEVASKHNTKGFCQDPDLQLAVISGLGLPKDYPDAQRANKIFANQCFAEQVAAVAKEVSAESGNSYLKTNTCPILEKHKQAPASCQPEAVAKPEEQAQDSIVEKLPKIDKGQIVLGAVKAYSGPEGERVTMAPIQGTDLFLIRFDGVTSPWEGKTLLHQRADRGNDAADFWTENNGKRWVSVVKRSGMEVYVPGYKTKNGFFISHSNKLSQQADAKALLNGY